MRKNKGKCDLCGKPLLEGEPVAYMDAARRRGSHVYCIEKMAGKLPITNYQLPNRKESKKMATTKGICGVPNCGKPGSGRGLCATHYYRAFNGKDGPGKDEALRYATPSNRKQNPTPDVGGDDDDTAADIVAEKQARAQAERQSGGKTSRHPQPFKQKRPPGMDREGTDERIAVITEFATAMGIPRVPYQGGFLFMKPNGLMAVLTGSGLLRDATIQLAEAK